MHVSQIDRKESCKRSHERIPAVAGQLVTLANWRTQPYSEWSFHNVRRVLPTANIAASKHPVPLESSLAEIGNVAFEGNKGPTTLREALRTTNTKGFVALRRGRIAAEWYASGMDATTPHIVFSVSKSIAARSEEFSRTRDF